MVRCVVLAFGAMPGRCCFLRVRPMQMHHRMMSTTLRSHARMKLLNSWDQSGLFDPLFSLIYRLWMLCLIGKPQHTAETLVSSCAEWRFVNHCGSHLLQHGLWVHHCCCSLSPLPRSSLQYATRTSATWCTHRALL